MQLNGITRSAQGYQINPTWLTRAISHSSQYFTTGVTNAVVCATLCIRWCTRKDYPIKRWQCFPFLLSESVVLYHMSDAI